MTLRQLDANLWALDQPLRVGPLQLGARTTVLRVASGDLVIHSPGPSPENWVAEVEKLGAVRGIVAPNALHHLFLPECARQFPDATVYAAPGVAAKQPSVSCEPLTETAPRIWADELAQHAVGGMPKVNEFAFFHGASRSLLLTDLAFNICSSNSLITRLGMRVNGAYGRLAMTRMGRSMVADRAAFRRSVEAILAWDFDRVIVAHGDVVETGGREALIAGFAGV